MKIYQQLTLASAISLAIFGATGAQAHVSYNNLSLDKDAAEEFGGWVWSDGDPGYTGNMAATWAAFIHNDGGVADSVTANSAGAGYTLGVGARAYRDTTTTGVTNWGHNADFGLFHLEAEATVTITMSSDGSDLHPAFGLWSGWATGGSRHGEFANNGAVLPMAADPLNSGLGLVDVNAWAKSDGQGASESASLTRSLAAGNYTLILGGYDGTTAGAHLGYSLNISAAPIPVPAAVWLFGSALAGWTAVGRRKSA